MQRSRLGDRPVNVRPVPEWLARVPKASQEGAAVRPDVAAAAHKSSGETAHPPAKRSNYFSQEAAAKRAENRGERDLARGYRINIKQVVLAFVVEFVIIGLILVGQYVYAAQIPNASAYVIIQTLLFPIALAMVELARVPLAIAVRVQKNWNIQLAALFGVACAVVVTSASLYQIGNFTFNPRLEEVHSKNSAVEKERDERQRVVVQKEAAAAILEQKRNDWSVLSDRQKTLSSQLNAQPGQNCTPTSKRNEDGSMTTTQTCRLNPALKTLQSELAEVKTKLNEAEVAGRAAQSDFDRIDLRPVDQKLAQAEAEYRDAVYLSPLHSYTAMLFSKDPRDVTEGEVKTLEWYLILIPSIAAALSSTLIAMTAVHRIKAPLQTVTTIPDDAMTYLFGPLLEAVRKEANDAIVAVIKPHAGRAKAAESTSG